MKFCVITLLPEILGALNYGIIGRAIKNGQMLVDCINPRDYAEDKYKTVDDVVYGGGPGLVMMAKPLHHAIEAAKQAAPKAKVIYLSPQGIKFCQEMAKKAAKQEELILIAGRYEGIDQRIIDTFIDEEWSLGDYVLSGGEFAALAIIDAIGRCVSGVVGDAHSVTGDSFYEGLLKHPQYTRPESFLGMNVPDVLLSGNHRKIARWRKKHSLGNTWTKRPDLLENIALDKEAQLLLNEFVEEYEEKP